MPITVKLKSTRLTNDQHRVEVSVEDVPIEAMLRPHDVAPADRSREPGGPATGSLTTDVLVSWSVSAIEESGFSHVPDLVIHDHPAEGEKTLLWRGFGIGERRHFLAKRTRPGAYTVDLTAEAHVRITAHGAGTTVTFPPTP
jgi:hypothetical protein